MAELRIEKPTLITQLEGTVFVMDAEGSLRRAAVGMQLQSGERLLAESNGRFELADSTDETHDPNQIMLAQADQGDALDPELASLQEAIRQGADPTALFEETAAGNDAAGTAGGVVGSSAGGFVVVDLNNDFTVAEAGFDTDHQTLPQGNEDPYVEDQDQVAEITITEPQTLDNIINADEATGVIIRGTVEDVEVGQTVTVTLTDQNGNSLTMTTVVLPGFVWEANFGDVTGKLVDGPLTIQADTQDAAGNRASDIGETLLDTITTITLDLADESDTGASQVDDLTRDTTPLLQGKGEPGATVTLSLGGTVLAVLTVDGNGNWQYQIPSDMADGAYDFRVDSVDIAGNRASDILTVTVDTQASIDIDDLDTNRILGHDNVTLSGTTTQVEAGQSVTITLIGQNGQTLYSGTALVGSDGRWQLSGLDLSTISGPYEVRAEVTDLAGNRVIDGAPLIGQSDVLTLSEADLAKGPVSATGSLHTGAGMDGNLQVSFAADQSALEQLGLSSHGSALSYQINGQTLTATAGGNTVFTLTLSNDGSYQIVWNQSLDHGQDSLNLPFSLEYRDSDGDLVHANLNVNLVDSTPPDFTLSPITLTEDAFTDQGVVVGQSHFVVGHQADPLLADSVVFADQANTLARLNGSGLSSDGHVLSFEFSGDRLLTGYYIDDQGNRVEVIKAELNASQAGSDINGTVTVTLNGPLDHQGNDELSLGLTVSAKEIDGDETRADLVVSINDGVDPNLGIDSGISLQEGGASQNLDGQLPVNVGSDRLVSLNFEASQPGLDGLTSGGKATTYQVNGNQITLLDAGGKVILTVTLDLDGKYHLQLDGVLDQPLDSNSVNLGLQVQGTDFDGDQSNLGTLNIAITDGALPSVDAVSISLAEDSDWSAGQSLSGDLNITAGADPLANISFDANQPGLQGLTSGGQPVVISISGNSISGSVNGQNVFTLTLDQQGHYVFTLNQPLDQGSADSLLKAGFTLTDSDGDKVSSSLSVAIGDGANPVISAVTGTEMTEANQGDAAVVSNMSFTVSHGSDALEQSSLRFDIAAIQQSLDGKYSSHGSPVTFTLDAKGELVGTTADGREVLRAELDLVDNNGNWSVTSKVTLSGELDHQGNESLDLPLTVTLTDKDGDSVSTDLPLVIKDGNAPGFVAGPGVNLDERGLDGNNTLTGTGHFQVHAGSDQVSEVSFADPNSQPLLMALGQQVKYELADGDPNIPGSQILRGYVEVNGVRVEVLQVEISGNLNSATSNGFDYKVTLYQGVHQNGGASTDLPFKINVVDSDKGTGNNDSTTGTLNVSIAEGDKPTLSLTGVTLSEGRFDGAGSNQTADDQQATGKLTIKADSDPVVDVRLTLAGQVVDASGKPITHNGETLTWQEVPGSNGHSFQAVTASGTLVLTVTLPSVPGRIEAHTDATLDYQVTVHTNLDHGADNNLNLTLPVQVTDSDGSVINGNTTAVINDAADPNLGIDSGISLQEGGASQSLDGQLPVNVGSDRLVSLNFEASQPGLDGLTSGGKATTYQVNGNQITLLDAGGKVILTVTLDLDGKYHLQLDGVLDQPLDSNSVNLGLQVQGTDFDGDQSNLGTLNIAITDGALPSVDAVTLDLVEDSDWSAGQSLSGDLNITAGADPLANISFDANQPGLQGLTSGGQPVVISISGNSISGTVNGQNVFTLTLDQQGHYVFTLNQPLDQGSADSLLKAGFTLTDSDGDTVSSSLSVAIGDGANPVISAVTGTEMTEANQGDAAVVSNMSFTVSHGSDALDGSSLKFDIAAIQQSLDGKYSSHGSPVTFTLDANGDLVGMADGREVLRAELDLTDDGNGNWSVTSKVTLSGELDHQGNESLDLPLTVTLTDKDGDSVSTDLPLVIKDGNAPGFVAGSGVSLDEGDLNGHGPLTGTGHFEVNAGSDRVSEVSFADISQQPKLTALGQSVIYELVDGDPSIPGNQILKGYVMVDGQRVEVLEVEISGSLNNAASNGFDYKVTLHEGVHQENGSTSTDLPFQINVVDSDKGAGNNDSTSGTLNVSIGEGNNPTINLTGVTLNEGRFDGAGSNQTADDQQATGQLTIKADSDPVVDVRLTLAGQVVDASGKPITHNGETLTWQEVPGSNGHSFQAVTASGTLVLTVTLPSVPGRIEAHTEATLDYQVTVHTNLDHGTSDDLNLTLPVQVTDSDGSVINGNTNVVITDAANPLISNIESVRVEEADLDASNTQHPGTTPTESGEAAGGKVTISAGSDRVASLELDVAAFNQANHLTSGGKEVTLAAHSNPGWYLASTADGKPVFWIHLDVNGSYSFHLVGQLDHGAQGKDELGIEIPLYVTDHDGDRSPNVTVEVTVQDDMPIGTSLAHTLNETGSSVNGDLLPPANEGADGARVVSVTVNGQVHAFNGSLTLDVMSPDGKQMMGSLTIGEDGNYSFTPRPGFDHDDASLSQVITAQIVDGDGDTAESTLTLNMEDEAVRFTVNAATGQEDQGAQDPSQGIPINMQLDIGDFDRGEHVDQLLIQAPANAHGTFYYNGVALTTTADGKWFIVPPAAMVTSDNVHYSTSGLTFVPADDWSSWSNNKQPLHFQVQVDVGVTEGTPPPPVTGDLAITVQGIADKPEWDSSTAKHYSINEDGSGVALNVQANLTDTDGSETLSYQIKWASGEGSLTLNGKELKPDANGVYTVSAGDINKITVVPGKDYSGDIKLSITPVSTEKTPVVSGQDKALGDSIELVINVNPQADDAKLTVREIQSKEDTLMNLGSKIVLAHLGDTADGSEQMFVRISGLPAGATLLLGGVAVVMDANGYYEVPYDRINELQMQPPKNSNVDFDLTIKGVVKDTATLTDANGQTHTVVNEKETGSQNLHVDMVGVVDEPHFNLDSTGWTPEGNGYTITIAEDGRAPLDFRLESGEKVDTPLDNSETLNLVLEGLPEGAKVFDGNGNELTLTFAGLDANGKPIYQVNVSDLGNLQIQPPPNSTADIHLIGHVVVTENDGDHKSFDVPLTIKVEPAIDAGDYAKTSHGLEDQYVVLDWHPDLSDSAEKVTHLSLSGIEPGYEIWVKDANGTHQLTLGSDGSVTLSDADLQSLLNGGQLLVRAPEDSDRDTNIQSHVTVTQVDVDSSATAQKVIDGNLHVDIQAVVEPDGNLVQTGGALESPDGHDIPLQDVFVFQDLDPSSVETIDYLVISDLPPGFVVIGGINDGYGNWTVPHDALGSYALRSPDGFTGTVNFKVSAQVVDLSDDGDVSASVRKDLNASADFHAATNSGQVAATVDLDNSQPITGVEDHNVNFGSQLKSMITLGTADIGDDELSIVLTGLPPGVSVQGLTYDFVNGEYLIKLPNGLSDLDNLTLTLPEDYAGDDLSLHVRLVNTDTVSGDTKTADQDITLSITPEVDVNGGADGMPSLQLDVKDVNGDGQPDNLEDTEIHLDLSVKLADISPSVANGGLETVERVTVTVDAKYGHFLDANGNPVQSLVVDANGLKDLVFIPKEHYSGQVPLDVKVDILDTATTGTDRGSWSGQVGFEVKPVNDPAKIIVHDVKGDEDGRVNLGGFGAELIDTDGSEKIVGLQITGVPDGFTLSAPAVNNGNGVWQIPVGTDFSTLTLIPPANFSGSVDLTLTAYTLDNGLSVPLGTSGNFTVTVNPVGDVIIADIETKASGTEGDVITLNLGLETRDTQATGGSAGNVHENGPEQVRVTIEGVPDGAQIRLPNGVNGTVVDLGNGRWQVTTDGTKLGAIELVTNDANGALDLKVTAQSVDNGALGPEVNGTIHVDISPVNDAPINVLPTDPQVAQEDQPFVIKGLQVKDVDAGSGDMKVTLSVEHGTLNIPAGSGVTVVGNGTGSLVLSGSLDAINALLNGGVTYQGNPDYHGSDNLTMVTNDNGNTGSGGALSDTDVLPIEVQPVNDAPVNVLPSDPQVAQEDQPFVIHGLQVSDVDAGSSPLTVTLSVLHGTLNLVAGNGVTVTGNGTGSLVLSGSQDAINALLNGGVTYQGEQDFNGQDALTMVTNDNGGTGNGGAQSDTDVLPIEVEAVNDAPVNQAPDAMQVKEDGALSLSGISVKDVDAGSAPMSMVLRVEHGVLTLLGTMSGNVVATGTGTNEITLVGSLAELNALISGNLHYEPAKDFWGQDNLTITTSDQGNTGAGGALTDTSTVGITVTAEADDPQLSLGAHDIHALQGAWVPLNLSASVVNPAPGELSVRIQNLGGAQVVDEHGQSVGHADSNGDWLLPMDQSVPIYLKDLPAGDHALILSAESSLGDSTLGSSQETLNVHSQVGHDLLGTDQNDWLFGSSGDDRILGGQGNDILTGGEGSDLFVWGSGDEGTIGQPALDTITDFKPEQGDKIDLADLLQGVTDNSVDGLLNHLSASVTSGNGGLSDVNLSVSPAGDGQVTQQITLKDVDLSDWSLSIGSSSHDILQSLLDQNSLIIEHP